MTKINVELTLSAIMNATGEFKIIDDNKETGTVTIATSVNDNFSRSVVIINSEMIAAGLQSPDEEGKITLTYTPIGVDLLSIVQYDVIKKQDKEDVLEEDVEEKEVETPKKKAK